MSAGKAKNVPVLIKKRPIFVPFTPPQVQFGGYLVIKKEARRWPCFL
jgi:hypothetical protein